MINRISAIALAGGALVSSLALSGVADAAYSGVIRRSECGSSLVPKRVDRAHWDYILCNAAVSDSGSPNTSHAASLSIPVERATSVTNITIAGQVTGGLNGSRVCLQGHVYNSLGNLTASTAQQCTAGAAPAAQQLNVGVLVLPINGTLLVAASVRHGGVVKNISASWLANGT